MYRFCKEVQSKDFTWRVVCQSCSTRITLLAKLSGPAKNGLTKNCPAATGSKRRASAKLQTGDHFAQTMRSAYTADMLEATEATAFLLSTGTACSGSFHFGLWCSQAGSGSAACSSAAWQGQQCCGGCICGLLQHGSALHQVCPCPLSHTRVSTISVQLWLTHIPLKCCSISVIHAGLTVSTENLMRPCVKRTLRLMQFPAEHSLAALCLQAGSLVTASTSDPG